MYNVAPGEMMMVAGPVLIEVKPIKMDNVHIIAKTYFSRCYLLSANKRSFLSIHCTNRFSRHFLVI